MTKDVKRLAPLQSDMDWEPTRTSERVGLWTDDFSNILTVLRWWGKGGDGE
jgi:hypothetical protein